MSNLSEYERQRLENIKRNAEVLQELDIETKFSSPEPIKRKITAHKGLKIKKRASSPQPARRSSRLAGVAPEYNKEIVISSIDGNVRQRRERVVGPLSLESRFDNEADEEVMQGLSNNLKTIGQKSYGATINRKAIDKLDLKEENVAKVCGSRIFRALYHPSTCKRIVCVGDKDGTVAIWDVDSKQDNTVAAYAVHDRPVSGLVVSKSDNAKLATSSYDGCVCMMDLASISLNCITALDDRMFTGLDIDSTGKLIYASDTSGDVHLIDTRIAESSRKSQIYELHPRKIASINISPTDDHLFATASVDRTACVWDVRKLKTNGVNKPVHTMEHGLAVSSAFFSPTGRRLLTTSMDNTVKVWTGVDQKKDPGCKSVSHFNQTGRWVTPFRAVWDPKSDATWVIGNMSRFADIYDADSGDLIRQLASEYMTAIPAANSFHPVFDEVACATYNRVHIFKP